MCCCNTYGAIASFLASRCNSIYVLPQNFVVALVVVVVAIVLDFWQRGLPWLHLNLSIATLFVPTGEQRSGRDSSLIETRSNTKSDTVAYRSLGRSKHACRLMASHEDRSWMRLPRHSEVWKRNFRLIVKSRLSIIFCDAEIYLCVTIWLWDRT